MEAGLLFYCSRRTSVCEADIVRAAGWFGLKAAGERICTREDRLNRCMAALFRTADVVFVVGRPEKGRPSCAEPLFRTLGVPLGEDGEPKGVRRLAGRETVGYLVESARQAIVILPDDPCEILAMLPAAMERLRAKFGLSGGFPAKRKLDYENLVEQSMGPPRAETSGT